MRSLRASTPRPYQAAFDQARATREKDVAQLANARRDLDRYLSLEPSHLASRQQIDTQKGACYSA